MKQEYITKVVGLIDVFDKTNGELIQHITNEVHPQNMARVIARGLANENNHQIFKIALGNNGTYINSTGQIVYNPPNVTGVNSDLYSVTYEEVVDDASVSVGVGNSVISQASPAPEISSIVICTIQLSANEPAGQAATDEETTDPNSVFTFDEIGLKTEDGLLLSHAIFNPIEKNAQREILISYTLLISVTAS